MPPSEVSSVDGFAPCGYFWVAHGGIIKVDELVCIFTFIYAVGLWERFGWQAHVSFPWNDVVLIVFQGDSPESGGWVAPPSEDYFAIVHYLTPCLVKK